MCTNLKSKFNISILGKLLLNWTRLDSNIESKSSNYTYFNIIEIFNTLYKKLNIIEIQKNFPLCLVSFSLRFCTFSPQLKSLLYPFALSVKLLMNVKHKKDYFYQRLESAEHKCWSNYTTIVSSILSIVVNGFNGLKFNGPKDRNTWWRWSKREIRQIQINLRLQFCLGPVSFS